MNTILTSGQSEFGIPQARVVGGGKGCKVRVGANTGRTNTSLCLLEKVSILKTKTVILSEATQHHNP
jgi:hypothetical protein